MDVSIEEKKRKFTDWRSRKDVVAGGWTGVFKDPDIDLASLVYNRSYWQGAIDKYVNPEEVAPPGVYSPSPKKQRLIISFIILY